jgi:hypothetical protein
MNLGALLVAAGAAVLWPALAPFGRGVGAAALIALLFATPAYGVARGGDWRLAAAFVAGAVLVRAGLATPDGSSRRRWLWRAGAAAATFVAVPAMRARGAGLEDIADGLFSSANGLFFWSPAAWLGIAGLVGLGRRIPSRALAPALLWAVAVAADPGSVRGGRFAPVLPLLGLGIGWTLAALRDACARRPTLPIAAGVAAFSAWNFLLMAQYGGGGVPRDDTVAFERVVRNAAASVSAAAGTPTAWPANWVYAARNGVPPARYDVLAGMDLFDGPLGLGGVIDVGDARTDAALLDGAWSVRHPCGAAVCRAVEAAATLRAPLRRPRDLDLAVTAAGTGTLTVAVNGVPVLAAPLDASLAPRRVRVPAGRLRSGLNRVTLSVDAGARALVDRITFADVGGPA